MPLLPIQPPKSLTETMTCKLQIITFVVVEKGMKHKGEQKRNHDASMHSIAAAAGQKAPPGATSQSRIE